MERGDKQESKRQFRLNYAGANFILMAETPPHGTRRPKHTHVNTNAEQEYKYAICFLARTLGGLG